MRFPGFSLAGHWVLRLWSHLGTYHQRSWFSGLGCLLCCQFHGLCCLHCLQHAVSDFSAPRGTESYISNKSSPRSLSSLSLRSVVSISTSLSCGLCVSAESLLTWKNESQFVRSHSFLVVQLVEGQVCVDGLNVCPFQKTQWGLIAIRKCFDIEDSILLHGFKSFETVFRTGACLSFCCVWCS